MSESENARRLLRHGDGVIWGRKYCDAMLNGKWIYKTQRHAVRVMAIKEGWAMIRLKGCMPTTCRVGELSLPNERTEAQPPENQKR
jgi:hypothetical protein